MAEVINNRVAVGLQELDGIVRYKTLMSLAHRGQAEIARRGCRGTSAMYYVDSLPYSYRCEVYRRYPDLNAQAKARPFIDSVEPDGAAINYYEEYTFSDGTNLPPDKIDEYSNNAAVLNAFKSWLERSNSLRKKTSHAQVRKGEFWAAAAEALPRIADRFPNTLPLNPRRLQEKYNEYIRDGYPALISGKHKNSNASKIDTEEKKAVICALCAIPNGFDNEFIALQYNDVAKKFGWNEVTAGTIAKYRKENGLLIEHARHGGTHFSNNHAMQVRRSRPTAAMLLWSLDGWDAELYYQKRNAKGAQVYTGRMVLEVVLDPCCDYPIGYAIGEREDAHLITEALRNAANHTKELFGSRYRTCQLQSDHFALKSMTPYYSAIADKVTTARVKNAKTKPVERYFRYLNETYCKTQSNWSGYGITAAKDHQPSAEFHNLIKRNFPDEQEVIRQLEAIIAVEREKKRTDYLRMWEATPEERRLPLSDEKFLLRFGKTTGYTNVLEGAGLRPRILGHKHTYDSFDVRFREASWMKWEVLYDESDLSQVLAVSEDGTRRFMLEEKYTQPMALAERKEGDAEQLARIQKFNEALNERHKLQFATLASHATPLLGGKYYAELENPDTNNDLAKALITDSKGQHKVNRSKARRRALDAAVDADYEDIALKKAEIEIVREYPPAGEERINTFDLY